MRALGQQCFATHCHLRSEEHTSELQSQSNLVCRLLLEKKNNSRNFHLNSQLKNLYTSSSYTILQHTNIVISVDVRISSLRNLNVNNKTTSRTRTHTSQT